MNSFLQTDYKTIDIKKDDNWREIFENYRNEILQADDALIRNYAKDRLKVDDHSGFFITINNSLDIVAFYGVYKRDWWPEGFFRIGNRTWVDPRYRSKSARHHTGYPFRLGWLFTHGHDPMIECCKENGGLIAFASKENTGRKKNVFVYTAGIELPKLRPEWSLLDGYYNVVGVNDTKDCWQKITYRQLTNNDISFVGFDHISDEEFEERFINESI